MNFTFTTTDSRWRVTHRANFPRWRRWSAYRADGLPLRAVGHSPEHALRRLGVSPDLIPTQWRST